MFLFKVLYILLKILLFLTFLEECFSFVQTSKETFESGREMQADFVESLYNTTDKAHERPTANSEGNSSFVYRRQHSNESMEKIQITNNGIVKKSMYIPVISKHVSAFNLNDIHKKDKSSGCPENESFCLVKQKHLSRVQRENIITMNGKKYKVIKVKKSFEKHPKKQMQRTFTSLPNLLTSILPLKWMTRQNKNETESETRSENSTQWTKLMPVENQESLKYGGHSSEKIKKLLNLFTIVKFDNGECYANGIKGTCLLPEECEAMGKKFKDTCAEFLGVCCYSEKTCGETSKDNNTYFINEGFPDSSTIAPKVCTLTLEKSNPDVQQLRLDFLIFQDENYVDIKKVFGLSESVFAKLKEPTNGTCLQDRLVISGQNINDVVPELCGSNTGQHIYVDIEESSGPFSLNIITTGEYFPRNFRIKISQVKKNDELLAPKNCLQYYAEPTGYVQTFNYQQEVYEYVDEVVNGYFNNLNYAICIKKQKGFCSITYENEERDTNYPTFQLTNVDEDGEILLPPRQAGAETFDCPDDYIIINGIRLCGEKFNDASTVLDYTRNFPVTDTTNGPFVISVRTDSTVTGRGFYLKYVQNPCLT